MSCTLYRFLFRHVCFLVILSLVTISCQCNDMTSEIFFPQLILIFWGITVNEIFKFFLVWVVVGTGAVDADEKPYNQWGEVCCVGYFAV